MENTPMAQTPGQSPVPMAAASQMAWPSAGQLLSKAWQIYKARAKTLLLIALIPALILFIAGLIVGGTASSTDRVAVGGAASLILLVIALIVGFLEQGALVTAVSAPSDPGLGAAYKTAGNRFGALIVAGILAAVAVTVGLVMFIVPGIVLAVWFCLAAVIVMVEGKGGVAALKASKAYVSGRWSKVAWYLLILVLVIIGLAIVVAVASGILGFINPYLGSLLNLAFNIAVVPLGTAYSYVLYDTLRSRPQ
jgi:hypothetical protein